MGLVSNSSVWPNFTWVSCATACLRLRAAGVVSAALLFLQCWLPCRCLSLSYHLYTTRSLLVPQVDNRTPGPSNSSRYYNHWGRFKPSKEYEPNNLIVPPENCGGANASEAFGMPSTWGWADWNCSARYPIMCKMQPPLVARCDFEGHAYLLNTTYSPQKQAEQACQLNGGHLVGYDRLAEQVAVENCFISQGFLLPKFHVFYWMGMVSGLPGATWPNFTWIDWNEAIYKGNYQHWGIAGKDLEPNNQVPPEHCAGSNLTVWYTNCGGWADHNCREQYVYVCEIGDALSFATYSPPSSNSTFKFYSTPLSFDAAERVCNAEGGHLASYESLQEQVRSRAWKCWLGCSSVGAQGRCQRCYSLAGTAARCSATAVDGSADGHPPFSALQYEVEQFYSDKGWLLPVFHKAYWIGLNTSSWPSFR